MKRRTAFFTLLFFLLSNFFVYAAIWEDIPALPQAQRVKQEEGLFNNNPLQTTVYTTLATPQETIEFYKTKLTNFGWELESELNQQGIEVLMFSKEDKFLNIMLQNILDKNFITIAQSIKPEELTEEKQGEAPSEIPSSDSAGRDLRFVPRYPDAVRISNAESENGKKVSLAYYTKDPVEDVVDFYLKNMGNYYWSLENELDFQNLPGALTGKLNVDIKGRSLVFKSPSASCIISITEEPQNNTTVIGVNYSEN